MASVGGSGAFKLMRLLSGKFIKACNPFADNTLISTEFGFEDIDEVQIGERVWAFDEETGEVALQEVTHTIIGQELKTTIDITLESGEVIQATAEHPLYAKDQALWNWVNAEDLTTKMVLIDRLGEEVVVTDISKNQTPVQVYNMTVAEGRTYYVTTDEVLVHNKSLCKPLRSIRTNHILHGDKTGGFHHRAGGVSPSGRRITKMLKERDDLGYYKGKVRIRWGSGKKQYIDKESSFFPDTWSTSRD